jgi:hypothetical protein
VLEDLRPDERRIAFIHGPLEFVGTPCFKQDACDIDSNGRTGGDFCPDILDEQVRGTIRAHLVLQCGGDVIAKELVASRQSLRRQAQEFDSHLIIFFPHHAHKVAGERERMSNPCAGSVLRIKIQLGGEL